MKCTMKIRRHGFIDGGFRRAIVFKPPLEITVERRGKACRVVMPWLPTDPCGVEDFFKRAPISDRTIREEIGQSLSFLWLFASRNNYGPLARLRDDGKLQEIVLGRCKCKACKPNWMSAVQAVLDAPKVTVRPRRAKP